MSSPSVFAVHLWADDRHDRYCGCYHVAVPDGWDRRDEFDRAGVGCFTGDDGETRRAFFFADELDAIEREARSVTECYVESERMRTALRGWTPA